MIFSRYSLQIAVRVILIVLNIFFVFYFNDRPDHNLTVLVLSFLVLVQSYFFLRYFTRFQRDISDFLDIVKSSDTTTSLLTKDENKKLKSIYKSFNQIGKQIQKIKLEKESSDIFLKHILDKIPAGMMAFDEKHIILTLNEKAKSILKPPSFSKLDDLEKKFPKLIRWIKIVPPGTTSVFQLEIENHASKYLFSISEFTVLQKHMKIVIFHNIEREIELAETESYLRLIRVITHEINNSLTPITSLAKANRSLLEQNDAAREISEITQEDISDLKENSRVIEERSAGMLEFVSMFRKLTSLPEPERNRIEINGLLQEVSQLFNSDFLNLNIILILKCDPENLTLYADRKMLMQVMINLVKNSIEAVKGADLKNLELRAHKHANKTLIQIIDSGHGIKEDLLDNIFVPFYTTRENGSGIGLSFSKQVMILHKGEIKVSSIPGKQTVFELIFPE